MDENVKRDSFMLIRANGVFASLRKRVRLICGMYKVTNMLKYVERSFCFSRSCGESSLLLLSVVLVSLFTFTLFCACACDDDVSLPFPLYNVS